MRNLVIGDFRPTDNSRLREKNMSKRESQSQTIKMLRVLISFLRYPRGYILFSLTSVPSSLVSHLNKPSYNLGRSVIGCDLIAVPPKPFITLVSPGPLWGRSYLELRPQKGIILCIIASFEYDGTFRLLGCSLTLLTIHSYSYSRMALEPHIVLACQ